MRLRNFRRNVLSQNIEREMTLMMTGIIITVQSVKPKEDHSGPTTLKLQNSHRIQEKETKGNS